MAATMFLVIIFAMRITGVRKCVWVLGLFVVAACGSDSEIPGSGGGTVVEVSEPVPSSVPSTVPPTATVPVTEPGQYRSVEDTYVFEGYGDLVPPEADVVNVGSGSLAPASSSVGLMLPGSCDSLERYVSDNSGVLVGFPQDSVHGRVLLPSGPLSSGSGVWEEDLFPDLVKTDGSRLLVLDDTTLHYFELVSTVDEVSGVPGFSGEVVWVSSLLVEGLPESGGVEMFLVGDYVLLVHGGSGGDSGLGWQGEATRLVRVDVSDPGEMWVVESAVVSSGFVTARRVGSRVLLVMSAAPEVSWGLEPLPADSGAWEEAREARARNRQHTEEAGWVGWVPEVRKTRGSGAKPGWLGVCEQVYVPVAPSGPAGVVSMVLLDPGVWTDFSSAVNVLADRGPVYVSGQEVYMMSSRFPVAAMDGSVRSGVSVDAHRFLVSEDGLVYTGSGEVPGLREGGLVMHSADGLLKVVSDEGRLDVLAAEQGELVVVSAVSGLVPPLGTVQFVNDFGLVMSESAPVQVLDMSDPSDPVVSGSVNGSDSFEYFRSLGDGLMVGVSSAQVSGGNTSYVRVVLLDMSDLSDPTVAHEAAFTEDTTFSAPDPDLEAFSFWTPTGHLTVPVIWLVPGVEGWVKGLWVLRLTGDGLVSEGVVTHVWDETAGAAVWPPAAEGWDQGWVSLPQRRVVFVGDVLVTLSDLSAQSYSLGGLEPLNQTSMKPNPGVLSGT